MQLISHMLKQPILLKKQNEKNVNCSDKMIMCDIKKIIDNDIVMLFVLYCIYSQNIVHEPLLTDYHV